MYNAQEFRNAHPVLQLPLKSGGVESLGQAQEQGFAGEGDVNTGSGREFATRAGG